MRSLATFLVCFLISAAVGAQPAPPPGGSISERYERARARLEEHRAEEDASRALRDQLAAEAEDLRDRLIANAARVQQLEIEYGETQMELARLQEQEVALGADLARDRADVARLLAVLQRLDADQPPALALRPDDSLAAARGAMVLGAVLSPVYERATELGRRLRLLAATREELRVKGVEARNQAEVLRTARSDLDELLQLRSAEATAAGEQLAEIHAVTEEAARETGDFRSLLDRIASLRSQAGPDGGMVVVTPAASPAGLSQGSLLRPVIGAMRPGDPAGPGSTPGTGGPSGLWFETGGLAPAVAPADSEVVFAGPYQRFGRVLILEIAGGYHLLLAGLGRIDVEIGDLVLAGEPVGVLPGGDAAQLYLELRRNGQAVNPEPWMSVGLRKARE